MPTQRTLAAELEVNMASVREALAVLGSMDASTIASLFEARRLLLVEAARLAATRRSDEQAARLRELAGAIATAADDHGALLADWAYMGAVIEAAGNLVFQLIMNSVRELYLPNVDSFSQVVARRDELLPLYARGAEAIRQRDPQGAADAIAALAGAHEARMMGQR